MATKADKKSKKNEEVDLSDDKSDITQDANVFSESGN
jgi:hypothetical protein